MNENAQQTRSKVKNVEGLASLLGPAKEAGKTVVQCHGVFDLLHIGHIRHFEQAKNMGDILVVTVTTDDHVNKGPDRPVFNHHLRAEAIAALDCVDYVAINPWPLATEVIELVRPDLFVKGSDYKDAANDRTGGIELERNAINSVGGKLVFTDDITFSSSNLINHNLPVYPKEVADYLADFGGRYSSDDVIRYLERARPLKALMVGETIIDEYLYCETLGKSGKEPVLAARLADTERFAGGIIAVANHVAALSDHSAILTFLGRENSQEDFIVEKLDQKIDKTFLHMEGNAPTIVKRRFFESYPFQMLFELYIIGEGEISPKDTAALTSHLSETLPDQDIVIVTDYGHGMLGPEAVELLCDKAPFLAINTQVNAGNRGFNTVSKYRRADFISVSENEIRLEARSRRKDLKEIVLDVAERLSCDRIIVTRGQQGSLCFSKGEGFFEIPAFAANVVDRIGAGDAVFAATALCAVQKAPMEIAGFIGNAVGAEAVSTVGHRSSIQRVSLSRHIETLLK